MDNRSVGPKLSTIKLTACLRSLILSPCILPLTSSTATRSSGARESGWSEASGEKEGAWMPIRTGNASDFCDRLSARYSGKAFIVMDLLSLHGFEDGMGAASEAVVGAGIEGRGSSSAKLPVIKGEMGCCGKKVEEVGGKLRRGLLAGGGAWKGRCCQVARHVGQM